MRRSWRTRASSASVNRTTRRAPTPNTDTAVGPRRVPKSSPAQLETTKPTSSDTWAARRWPATTAVKKAMISEAQMGPLGYPMAE